MVNFVMKKGADYHLKMKNGEMKAFGRSAWVIMVLSREERLKDIGERITAEIGDVEAAII